MLRDSNFYRFISIKNNCDDSIFNICDELGWRKELGALFAGKNEEKGPTSKDGGDDFFIQMPTHQMW